ncbi:MAG: type II toxin-antitoxin system VapC family toxin [Alphaproteobacteria bacterium]
MICVDTNAAIAAMKGSPSHLVRRFDRALAAGELALPAIVLFELWYGVGRSERRRQNADRLQSFLASPMELMSFDAGDAAEAGEIRAALARAGTPIGPYDLLIAAQARRRSAVLVTANTREFARVPGLAVEDWAAL